MSEWIFMLSSRTIAREPDTGDKLAFVRFLTSDSNNNLLRSHKTWLIGGAPNQDARELDIPLYFYKSACLRHSSFRMVVVPLSYRIESYKSSSKEASATDVIHVKLAPGGGACVLIKQ